MSREFVCQHIQPSTNAAKIRKKHKVLFNSSGEKKSFISSPLILLDINFKMWFVIGNSNMF